MSPLWGLHEEQHGEEPEHPAPRGAHRSEPRAGALARATAAAADPAATRGGAVRLLQPLRRPAAAGGPGLSDATKKTLIAAVGWNRLRRLSPGAAEPAA